MFDDAQYRLALARIRTALAHIAPEITEDEIVFDADLRNDLGLDTVSIWALATQLEALAHVEIKDDDICALSDVASLASLALTDVPPDYLVDVQTGKISLATPSPHDDGNSSAPQVSEGSENTPSTCTHVDTHHETRSAISCSAKNIKDADGIVDATDSPAIDVASAAEELAKLFNR